MVSIVFKSSESSSISSCNNSDSALLLFLLKLSSNSIDVTFIILQFTSL